MESRGFQNLAGRYPSEEIRGFQNLAGGYPSERVGGSKMWPEGTPVRGAGGGEEEGGGRKEGWKVGCGAERKTEPSPRGEEKLRCAPVSPRRICLKRKLSGAPAGPLRDVNSLFRWWKSLLGKSEFPGMRGIRTLSGGEENVQRRESSSIR